MIDTIFDFCVDLLMQTATLTGLSYKEVNVLLFCVLLPLLMFCLLYVLWGQHRTLVRVCNLLINKVGENTDLRKALEQKSNALREVETRGSIVPRPVAFQDLGIQDPASQSDQERPKMEERISGNKQHMEERLAKLKQCMAAQYAEANRQEESELASGDEPYYKVWAVCEQMDPATGEGEEMDSFAPSAGVFASEHDAQQLVSDITEFGQLPAPWRDYLLDLGRGAKGQPPSACA